MARIEKAIEIKSSSREIWPLICWDQVPNWMDQIKKAEYTSREKERVGTTAHLCGEAGGVTSEWDVEITEWSKYRRLAWRTTAGTLTGIGSVTLTPTNVGTKATLMIDYDLPHSILGKVIDKLHVFKAIEKGTERALTKLKAKAEMRLPNMTYERR